MNFFANTQFLLAECDVLFSHKIQTVGERLAACVLGQGKVFICGNGGSAAQAQHFSAELLNQYNSPRKGFPAIALTTDTSTITAIGNDYHFDTIFSKPFEALQKPGDMLICITTSGNSGNILRVIETANDFSIDVILLTGKDGGDAATMVPVASTFVVPNESTARIQEIHNIIIHGLCHVIDTIYFKKMDTMFKQND